MKKKTTAPTRATEFHLQAEQQLLSASAFLQAVQDSLSAHIAILDKNGVIVQVNAAWRRFGESNGLQTNAHCLGVNYLELCDSASGPNSEEASLTSRAIRDVLAGVQQEACIEYPCDGPDEKRWFMLKVTKFENEGDVWVVLAHENITERKWILESLSVSEARYRLLANNVPDIVYSLDGEGKIATVNSQAFERYGYTEQDSRGKPFLTFIHPEDREIVLQSFLNAMQEQRKFTHGLQFRIVAGDGASYWFELNSQARFDTAGRYLGEDGVLRDISERKRVEQALQKKETEYQTLVQNLMVGIVVHDPSTAILFSNAAASNLLGLTKEQLQGKSAMDPDWRFLRDDGTNMPLSEYPVNRVLSSGKEIYNFVAGISRRDKDKPVWVLCVAYPVYDMQDQLLQIVVTFSDITDRKQAEQDLRRSNDRYEQIVNTVPVMLYDYILRPDGVSDFLYVSPKMCREILELDSEAVLADMDLFWNMAHPQDISRLHQEDVMANLEGKLFYSEFRMIMPSGKMKWVSLNSKPRSVSPGEPAVWSGFLQDITERKEAEEALLKKMDELERFQRLTVGRELRMIELKKEVNHLLQQTGQQEKYRIVDEK